MPYGSTLHIPPTNLLLLAAKQEPYIYVLTKNILKNFLGKKFRRMDKQAEKDKTERVTELGRRTKWNQMTALRFQTGGRQTSDIPGLPLGFITKKSL